MFSNLQISRTLAKNNTSGMKISQKTVSSEAMQAEWQEIQAAQRNPNLFRPLYDRYYDPIFRFIFRRTAEEDLTGDICAQVFLKAMQRLDKYKFKGVPFSAWLYRIASNEIAQHFRNVKKNRVVSMEEHNLHDMAEEMDHNQREQLIPTMIDALQSLNENDVLLIELRFFEQRPFKEIANILGITESNAKVKTYRLLEKMKKFILNNTNPGQAPGL